MFHNLVSSMFAELLVTVILSWNCRHFVARKACKFQPHVILLWQNNPSFLTLGVFPQMNLLLVLGFYPRNMPYLRIYSELLNGGLCKEEVKHFKVQNGLKLIRSDMFSCKRYHRLFSAVCGERTNKSLI